MQDMLYNPPKRMQLIGFVTSDQVPRHTYMKVGRRKPSYFNTLVHNTSLMPTVLMTCLVQDCTVMVADKAEPAAVQALSAFARAMDASGTCGVVRVVARCDCSLAEGGAGRKHLRIAVSLLLLKYSVDWGMLTNIGRIDYCTNW